MALAAAFRNQPADIAANRAGRASLRQRARLLVAGWWVLLMVFICGLSTVEGLQALFKGHPFGAVLGTLVSVACLAFVLHLLWRIVRDFAAGRVDCVEGRLQIRYAARSGDASGTIHGAHFDVDAKQAGALRSGGAYAVYVFHHSRRAVGAETGDDPGA